MLTEQVLRLLRAADECVLTADGFGCVPSPLDGDPDPVKVTVARTAPELLRALAEAAVLDDRGAREPLTFGQGRRPLEVGEEVAVPIRVERGQQLRPRLLPLGVEELEDSPESGRLLDRLQLSEQVRDQDVAVSNLSQHAAEPPQLLDKPLAANGVLELRPGRPQQRAQASSGHALLVKLLRI